MTLSTGAFLDVGPDFSSDVFAVEESVSTSDSGRGHLVQARWHLACVDGPDLGAVIPLSGVSGSYTFGRVHSVVSDSEVSRVHLRVRWNSSGVEVCDAHSANGSQLVRQRRLWFRLFSSALTRRRILEQRWTFLRVGDVLWCGRSRWQLRSRPRVFTPPQPVSSVSWWSRVMHPRSSSALTGVTVANPHRLAGGGFQRVFRLMSIVFSLVFLPISLGRVVGISPWWGVGLFGLAIAFSLFGLVLRRNSSLPWDGARLLVALDKQASLSSPVGLTWSAPAYGSPVVFSPHTPALDLPLRDGQCPPSVGFYGPRALLHALWAIAAYSLPWSGCTVYSSQGIYEVGAGGPNVHLFDANKGKNICPFGERTPCSQALHCVVAEDVALLPSWCTHIGDCDSDVPVSVTWAALLLHRIPESASEYVLPQSVLLEDLWAEELTQIAASEDEVSGVFSAEPRTLSAAIGRDVSGKIFSIDIIHDGPHSVIVGTTGSGKSEAVITVLCSLARKYSPRDLRIVAVDYKGGASLSPLLGLPQLEVLLTDLTPQNTQRAFEGLRYVLRQREALLASRGFSSLSDWETHDRATAPARIIIAFDEFTTFASIHPDLFEDALRLAAQGRALGLHVIFATQRPDRALNAALLSNVDLRIALRCRDSAASQALLGSHAASELPAIPGRAIADGHGLFQTAWIPRIGQTVKEIAQQWLDADPTALWVPELPRRLTTSELTQTLSDRAVQAGDVCVSVPGADACPIGLVDGISFGEHYPLFWTGGHCRFEAGPTQRQEVWRTLCAVAQQCALASGLPLIVCASNPDAPINERINYQYVSLNSPCDVVALVSGQSPVSTAAGDGGKIVVLEDIEHTQRVLIQTLGAAYGQALWSTWLNSALLDGTTIFAASYQPRSLWDKEGHIFSYRFLKAVNAQQIQLCGLSAEIQPQVAEGIFLAISAPSASLLPPGGDSPPLPHPIRLLDAEQASSDAEFGKTTRSRAAREVQKSGWLTREGEQFYLTENSVIIAPSDDHDESITTWKNAAFSSRARFIEASEWMKIPSVIPPAASPDFIVITCLSEEVRRVLLPAAHQSDWLLRLKSLPQDRALVLKEGVVTLISYYR